MQNFSWKHFFTNTVIIIAIAEVANIALTALGKALSNPPETFGPYLYSSVIVLTAVGIIAAAIGYVVARYYYKSDAAKADRWFFIAGVVLLVVSFYPDIALPWSSDPDQVGWTYGIMANLMLMHVVVFIPIAYFYHRDRV